MSKWRDGTVPHFLVPVPLVPRDNHVEQSRGILSRSWLSRGFESRSPSWFRGFEGPRPGSRHFPRTTAHTWWETKNLGQLFSLYKKCWFEKSSDITDLNHFRVHRYRILKLCFSNLAKIVVLYFRWRINWSGS